MSSKILDSEWNIVVNLGIKCNTLHIARDANVRYYSSPFDNIDTVEGLGELGVLLASGFENYWSDINDWKIENEFNPKTKELRAKIIRHKSYPNIYYPHFHAQWIRGESFSKEELEDWKNSLELDLPKVWGDLAFVYKSRQQRLISILKNSKNKVLFLRADERKNLKRVHKTNGTDDVIKFIDVVKKSYPDTEIGMLYIACEDDRYPRELVSQKNVHVEMVPSEVDEHLHSVEFLKKIKLLPREQLLDSEGFSTK